MLVKTVYNIHSKLRNNRVLKNRNQRALFKMCIVFVPMSGLKMISYRYLIYVLTKQQAKENE